MGLDLYEWFVCAPGQDQLGAETSEDPEIVMDRGVLKHGHRDTQTFHYYHTQASWSEERDEGACEAVGRESLKGWAVLQEVQFSRSVISNCSCPHGLQHTRLPCPSPTPRAYSNSCLLSRWCHPTISSSVVPFSSCLQSFSASGSFPRSQFFASGGQSIQLQHQSFHWIFRTDFL